MPVQFLQYGLTIITKKTYTIATNSYTKYYTIFEKTPFFAYVRRLVAWISHLRGKKLKPKTIKRYLVGLESPCFDCTLDIAELEIYRYPIF